MASEQLQAPWDIGLNLMPAEGRATKQPAPATPALLDTSLRNMLVDGLVYNSCQPSGENLRCPETSTVQGSEPRNSKLTALNLTQKRDSVSLPSPPLMKNTFPVPLLGL